MAKGRLMEEKSLVEVKRTFEDLTPERQEKLAALHEELQVNTTSDMILLCQHAIGFNPKHEEDRKRLDRAIAGALGANRALMYLERLQILNEERKQIGTEVYRLQQRISRGVSTAAEVTEVATARAMLPQLPGKQEVIVNFFCISVQHVRSLLKTTVESVDYEIPQTDLDFLDEFRHLRNHFEHWYSRLTGEGSEAAMMTKTLTEEEYRVEGGLRTDDQNRYIVIELKKIKGENGQPGTVEEIEHTVDVTDHGVAEVGRILEVTDAKIREAALRQAREHFMANSETIPSPKSLPRIEFLKIGGGPKS
jgi:hypothetical protein